MSNVFNTWKELIPEDFSAQSRVWIYQGSRILRISEALRVEELLEAFTATWMSHGAPVKGYANLLFGQFIVLMADETQTAVGGCSTDSSVRVVKEIEKELDVNFFDRLTTAFLVKEKVEMLPISQLTYAFEKQFITPDTLYFHNLVQTKEDLLTKWIIPAKDSWLASRFKLLSV